MDNARTSFRVVLRGYETTEVDQAVARLTDQTTAAQQQVLEMTARVRELEAAQTYAAEQAEAEQAKPPSFGDFGARIGQILSLAEEEAAEIRASAKSDFEDRQREAEQAAQRVRTDADEYADRRRADGDTEAKNVLDGARRQADELREETERDAAARVAEAQAVYEAQRAKAAQAAADFETTLAERRDRVEQEFTEQFETARAQLDEAQAHLEQTRGESKRIRSEAELGARRLVEDAQQQADNLVAQARAHADRIRAESERELIAATQRRDSINAQLTNVRQMLATLSNVPVGLLPVDTETDAESDTAASDEPAADADEAASDEESPQG
jgi:cell division septum initiation protein DivIVA